jgi:hypothetical protein
MITIRTKILNIKLSKEVFINPTVGTKKEKADCIFISRQQMVTEKKYIQFFIRTKCLK